MQIEFARADYGQEEISAVDRVLRSDWLASGPENEAFEKEFARYIGNLYAVCVNSGSSANLLALASLNLPKGSKVLTSACGFPATLSPILHLGLKPVYVDYDIMTHNISVDQIINKTSEFSAIIFAHTLGNPVDVERIKSELSHRNIKIIEDCCEAVGASYNGQKLGTIGDLGTYSFYPAHQITAMGGGGMVTTNDIELYHRMKSLRDWGKMYDWDSDKGGNATDYASSIGYHRGYTYETVGWNFKLPEANCAFGREQLKKLDYFNVIRRNNWNYLYDNLKDLKRIYIPPMEIDSAPFGFCMMITGDDRNEFGRYLEANGIKHRPFFAGNILRQPAFLSDKAKSYPASDYLMNHSLFIGCHTKITKENLEYMVEVIRDYANNT